MSEDKILTINLPKQELFENSDSPLKAVKFSTVISIIEIEMRKFQNQNDLWNWANCSGLEIKVTYKKKVD